MKRLGFCEATAIFRASNPKNRFQDAEFACLDGYARGVGIFGGVEPPKMRGFLHAQTVRVKEPAFVKISLLKGICEFFCVRKKNWQWLHTGG
ncbi:MAG: hypothetical protein ACI4JZ_01220 [Oscillospiraceae bacterium]